MFELIDLWLYICPWGTHMLKWGLPFDASTQGAIGDNLKWEHQGDSLNQSANGTEARAPIQRIALSDSIYPMYVHMY